MLPKGTVHAVLYIEDEPDRADRVRSAFAAFPSEFCLEIAASLSDALETRVLERADVIFFKARDISWDFKKFLNKIRGSGRKRHALVLVAHRNGQEGWISRAVWEGVDAYVTDHCSCMESYPLAARFALEKLSLSRRDAELSGLISESQREWMGILDAITDYICVIDDQHIIRKANRSFAGAFGMQPRDMVGKRCADLQGIDILAECSTRNTDRLQTPVTYEKSLGPDTYQISVFPLIINGRYLTIHVLKNVSELRRLKEQLYHADKLASIGDLVSGVAHEINNPLTGTIAYTELLRMSVQDEAIRRELQKILDSAERCRKIVHNLLTFSRQEKPTKRLESVNDIIDRAIDLRNYWLRRGNIEIIRDYEQSLTVHLDARQLQLVVLNLLLNAEQAIRSSGAEKGSITFKTRANKQDRTIIINIFDSGPGISEQALSRIFDPFFTTKPVGEGTGLGLSIAHGIIAEHGGSIHANNVEGGGAEFLIVLPVETTQSNAGEGERQSRL